jgi:exonuclease SbcC
MIGRRNALDDQIFRHEETIAELETEIDHTTKAQIIIQKVAQETQNQFKINVNALVTTALGIVFENDAYEFEIDFVTRRGKTEADIWFIHSNGKKLDPMASSGGGAVDIAAFAARVALWNLSGPKTRPIIVLDEPFRFLSANLQPLASAMVKEISQELGIQIIMVTHNESLLENADHVIRVEKAGQISKIA